MTRPTPDDVRAAARLAPHVVRTPMLRHPLLDQLTGGTILVKPEPLQRTGSVKPRGATNGALKLAPGQRRAGGRGGVVVSGGHVDPAVFAEALGAG